MARVSLRKAVTALFLGLLMLLSTDAFAVSGAPAPASNSATPDIQQLPYYSATYHTQRTALASYMEGLYNPTYDLTQGTVLCGIQANGFSIIDENFLDGPALQEYDPSMGNSINSSVFHYLSQVGYLNNDRREVLFGNQIPLPPLTGIQVQIAGTMPTCPNGGKNYTGFFITTELPQLSTPAKSYTNSMNILAVSGLEDYLSGNVSGALELFNTALGWWTWNSTYHGFLSPAQIPCNPSVSNCTGQNNFDTRDLAYFLFFARATRFHVPPTTLGQIESTLWSQQLPQYGGGIATSYSYNGSALPKGGHTSGEINGLALLAYDPRIQTTWWPGAIQTLSTTTTIGCTPSSLMVNVPTTCQAMVNNADSSVSLSPSGAVSFESSGPGAFTSSASCTLIQFNDTAGDCSVSYTPGPGGEGIQQISADFLGDAYHTGSAGNGILSVSQRSASLSMRCSPSIVGPTSKVKCIVTVKDTTATGTFIDPRGSVTFSASRNVKFSSQSCVLAPSGTGQASCGVTFVPGSKAIGRVTVSGSYGGDEEHAPAVGGTSVRVR